MSVGACGTHNPADPNVKAPATVDDKKPAAPAPEATVPIDGPVLAETLGTWHVPDTEKDGLKTEMTVKLTDKLITIEKNCTFKNQSAKGLESAQITIDAATINLQDAIDSSAVIDAGADGTVSCSISLEKGKYAYEVKEGQLSIKKDGAVIITGDRKL